MKITKKMQMRWKETDAYTGCRHTIQLILTQVLRMYQRMAMILTPVGFLDFFDSIEGSIGSRVSIGMNMTLKPKIMEFANTGHHLLMTD
jgi:hypothetical protein